jgi:hypothetical protein
MDSAVLRAVQQARNAEVARQQALSNAVSQKGRSRLEVQFARLREHEAARIARLRNDEQQRAVHSEPMHGSDRVGVPAMVDYAQSERGLDSLSSSNLVFMRKMMQTLEPTVSPQLKSKRAKSRTDATTASAAARPRAGLLEEKRALLKLQLANIETLQRTLTADLAPTRIDTSSEHCLSTASTKSEASYATYGSRRALIALQKQHPFVPRIKLVRHTRGSEHNTKQVA